MDVPILDLEIEFDAIFVGIGLSGGAKLNLPGEDLPEVVDALHFIERIHSEPLHRVPVGERVAVIGGGNTAIDAVTQARRLGARSATVIYRRAQGDMSAYQFEQELAKADGAHFMFNIVPLEVLSWDAGYVTGLKLARTVTNNGRLQVLSGTEFIEPFDMVIKAISPLTCWPRPRPRRS